MFRPSPLQSMGTPHQCNAIYPSVPAPGPSLSAYMSLFQEIAPHQPLHKSPDLMYQAVTRPATSFENQI